MEGMRHVLVHDYNAVSLDVIWDAIAADLPLVYMRTADGSDALTTRVDQEARNITVPVDQSRGGTMRA